MNLALFDFDGTLTSKDSLNEFLKFSVSKKTYLINMLIFSPIFILYKLKFIKNDVAKEKLFNLFFKGIDEKEFKNIALDFSNNKLDDIVLSDRVEILTKHQNNNDRVIVVSASMECWLKPWCEKNNIELLATKLKFENGIFTGKFLTKNCYGAEKENRIRDYINLKMYDKIFAYGDSLGDKQMLSLAHKSTLFGQ